MAGALMRLVAYGHKMFTSQVTHKLLFSKLSTEDTLTLLWNQWNKPSTVLPTSVTKSYREVSRNGDLLGPCYVDVTLPAQDSGDEWVNRVGWKLLKQVELRIGGQMIDRQYSTWIMSGLNFHTPQTKKLS